MANYSSDRSPQVVKIGQASAHDYTKKQPYLDVAWGLFLEVKTDKGKLTEAEKSFMGGWHGRYAIVRRQEDALIAIGVMEDE